MYSIHGCNTLVKPRTGTDEWSRKQKNCYTKMVGAHPKPHFAVDERLFMVLQYTETGNVLETNKKVSKAVSESEDTVHTNNNRQLQLVCPVWFKFQQERRHPGGGHSYWKGV